MQLHAKVKDYLVHTIICFNIICMRLFRILKENKVKEITVPMFCTIRKDGLRPFTY